MSGNSTLFTSDLPKIIPMARLYDPDVDVSSSINTTKIIPTVNSLLVDDVYIYIVTAVDARTGKTTYRPLTVTDSNAVKRVFEYGNTFYALYFAKVQIKDGSDNNNTLSLTRLHVDDKLTFFGDNVTNYDIIKTDALGRVTIVSQNFNTENINTGVSCKIAGNGDYKKCVPCYSYEPFKSGESYTLRAYDSAGNQISSFVLIAVPATTLSQDISTDKTIVDFFVRANQYVSNVDETTRTIFLYQHQNVSELKIWPYIKFANNDEEQVAIDGVHGFIYGMEEIRTDNIGDEFDILVKYAIGSSVHSNIGTGSGENRYLTCSFKVHIVDANISNIAQVAVIPEYSINSNQWTLTGLVYYEDRMQAPVVKRVGENVTDFTITGFNGLPEAFNTSQDVDVAASQTNIDGTITTRVEHLRIEVRSNPNQRKNPFLISYRDNEDGRIYGNDRESNDIPPQILYGEIPNQTVVDADSNQIPIIGYYIPADSYVTTNFSNKVDCFLHNFYYNANPPMINEESVAPIPTHFTIRSVDSSNPILVAPVPIANFGKALALTINDSADQWVGATVIVEFVRYSEALRDYEILYGVPVRIRPTPQE